MRTFSTLVLRLMLLTTMVGGCIGFGYGAQAKAGAFVFADELPDGVTFQTLAAETASEFRFHVAGVTLARYTLDCSQASGKLFTKEQLLFVEWGTVEIHDWTTNELIATLHTGDSFAPTQEERNVYMTGAPGEIASVLQFKTTAGLASELNVPPDITYQSAGCHSGSGGAGPVEAALVSTLVDMQGAQAPNYGTGSDYTMYLGILTIAPGTGFFAKDDAHPDSSTYTSTGSAIFDLLVGGLGDSTSGGVGYGQVWGGSGGALFPGFTLGGLVNGSAWPVTILVAGTTPLDEPALHVQA